MPRLDNGALFVGRLSKQTRATDLEDVFYKYGKLLRCDVKYGSSMAYGFVEFDDPRDAEDAMNRENGREIQGSRIVVEQSRGPGAGRGSRGRDDDRGGFRDDRRPGGGFRDDRRPVGGGGYVGGGDRSRDRDRGGDRDRDRGGYDRRRSPSPPPRRRSPSPPRRRSPSPRYRARHSPSPRGRRY